MGWGPPLTRCLNPGGAGLAGIGCNQGGKMYLLVCVYEEAWW